MTGHGGHTRRAVLGGLASVTTGWLAGCTGSPDGPPDSDVIADPDGCLVFEPDRVRVAAGRSVVWYFASAGHNVCGRPEDSAAVSLPDGAGPFASYGRDEPALTFVPAGETFGQVFDVPGTYDYVCLPHVGSGMVGRVVVDP